MLVNTQVFREEAMYFQKHKKYDCGIEGSEHWKKWWHEQRRRCLEGYTSGGIWITGYNYWYLNFSQIIVTEDTYGKVHKDKVTKTRKGDRVRDFPDFWDEDLVYFYSLDIAENGIDIPKLDSLPVDVGVIREDWNLSGGKHLIYLKPRRVGASYKAGAICARDFFLIPESKSYLFADQTEYLTKDGVFNKFIANRSFINTNTAFAKRSDFKKSESDLHFRASYADDKGDEQGYLSEVIGVTFRGDKEKARGKSGRKVFFEEMGKFPNVEDIWGIARSSVEEDGAVYGTLIGFGTGGSEENDFEGLETMFYAPEAYGILAFNNKWDEGMEGTTCSLFTPAYISTGFKDKNGNSNKEQGKQFYDAKREEAKKSPKPNALLRATCEKPFTPQEAILNTANNPFLVKGLVEWRNKVANSGRYKNLGVPKELYRDSDGKVKAKPDWNLQPIVSYPHKKDDNIDGCVVEWFEPYHINGVIPDGLYYICHDPYASDDAEDTTSLGAAYVMMNISNIVHGERGDRIVASYIGRPLTTDNYNEVLFLLAERWNAKIGFESDRGDVIGYAKRFKKTDWLFEEFELAWDEKLVHKRSEKVAKYGMRIGSGRDNPRKLAGYKYIQDWLIEERGQDLEGLIIQNLHTIYDVGLLDELRLWKPKKNVDRISALLIGMFFQRELLYKGIVATTKTQQSSKKKFFKHQIYA